MLIGRSRGLFDSIVSSKLGNAQKVCTRSLYQCYVNSKVNFIARQMATKLNVLVYLFASQSEACECIKPLIELTVERVEGYEPLSLSLILIFC